jgi:nitrile hydratase
MTSRLPANLALLFAIGDRVRIDDRPACGHCRTPWYLRGRIGVVVCIHGVFRDPERLAYHLPGLPGLPLYKVRVAQADIWPGYTGAQSDHLEADIYEPWLTPAPAKPAGKKAARQTPSRGTKAAAPRRKKSG